MRGKMYRNISLIVGVLLAVIVYIFGCISEVPSIFKADVESSLPAFLFSIVILLISQIIAIQFEVDKSTDNTTDICKTVREFLPVTKIGTPTAAWSYIIDQLPNINHIQNTSFNYGTEINQTNYRLYDFSEYEKSLKVIAQQINSKRLLWEDIGDSNAKPRFEEIEKNISSNPKGRYSWRLINHNEPQIGFIIITYNTGEPEVLFNWDFRDIPNDPTVLSSRSPEIISMFSAQFNELWRVSTEHYDSKAHKSTS